VGLEVALEGKLQTGTRAGSWDRNKHVLNVEWSIGFCVG